MPDAELLKVSAADHLTDTRILEQQTERMLKDTKADKFIENFTGQWLKLREIDSTVPDKKLYPEYDEYLRNSIFEETKYFFKEILKNDLSIMNFIDSE